MKIARRFDGAVADPVSRSTGDGIRSHFGRLELAGVAVEVMGGVQRRAPRGEWESPVAVREHRRVVDFRDRAVPVLSLSYEARAYERLGRTERAATLRAHAATGPEEGDEDLADTAD